MSIKLRILSVISAICFLGATACFSGYAADVLDRISGDEGDYTVAEPVNPDPGYVEPDPGGYVEPDPGYVEPDPGFVEPDPGYTDPDPVVSADPTVTEPDPGNVGGEVSTIDPGYVDSGYDDPDPNVSYDPTESYVTYSDLISDGNYPAYTDTPSVYIDYTSQYIANTYSAIYDDNYYYVPEYTAPVESLIDTSSKVIDTDELTRDDWATIMLDLEQGNLSGDGTKTFNFIKNSEEIGDTSVSWMLYLGVALIMLSLFLVIFVIISSKKAVKYNYA